MANEFDDFEEDFDDEFDDDLDGDFIDSDGFDEFDDDLDGDFIDSDGFDEFDDDLDGDFIDSDGFDEFDESLDFDFDDDFYNWDSKSKEDIDIFDEKPLETDSGYERTAAEVHVSTPLSSRKIVDLMETYPGLKRITCPPSIYNRISPVYIKALKELNINIEVKHNWGKKKYNNEEINSVIDLLNENKSPEEVSTVLDIPLERVNYFKSKYHHRVKVKRYNRKYGDECRQKVISFRENGIKPKEISKQLGIPLRSVYYILNKK